MKILVGGYWDPKRAIRFRSETVDLGRKLGELGHDVIAGPGSGVIRFLLQGYTSVDHEQRGKVYFYRPHPKEMVRVGEVMGDFADEVIDTGQEYLERTATMCRAADAFMSIAGASGTIFEAVAMMFLKKPVIILEEAGAASNAAQILGGLKVYAKFAPTVDDMIEELSRAEEGLIDHRFEEKWYNV